MYWLREALATRIPGKFLHRYSWGEQGRRFALRVSQHRGEQALIIRLGASASPMCDLLVLACAPDRALLVAFVEIKGADVRHALTQIQQTHERYCRRNPTSPVHENEVKRALLARVPSAHGGTACGLIICKRAMPLEQTTKARLRKQGLKVVQRNVSNYSKDLSAFYLDLGA